MPETLTDKTVTTRKPHRCWGCAREFPAGTKLTLIESVDGGEWYRGYWCPVCEAVWDNGRYYRDDEGVSFGELKREDNSWEETRVAIEGEDSHA